MKRMLSAAVMAAAVMTLGLAMPDAATATLSTGSTTASVHDIYVKGRAGYEMRGGGWRFRYIEAALTVPACSTHATTAEISLWSTDRVALTMKCDGGPGSITYDLDGRENNSLALRPQVGDRVTISIYQDRATGRTNFTAVNLRTGRRSTVGRPIYQYDYATARVMGYGPAVRAGSNTRLWAFTGIRLTSLSGTRGTILGPWNTYRTFGTTGTGTVVLEPHLPWNDGRNFGVWWITGRPVPR